MNKPTLHLLMGLPGSGKTTLSKMIQDITGAKRVSSDESRLEIFDNPCFSQKEHDELYALLDHNVKHLLEDGQDVIYDANLNRRHHREEKYTLADKYDAKVVLWLLSTPGELSKKRRLSEHNHNLIPDGETPENMFDRIQNVFEPPGDDETHVNIDGSDIDIATVRSNL
ncbi:MAG: putative kinase [Candidatus Saccharimonadales bacterium]|jgi:predicted kinase